MRILTDNDIEGVPLAGKTVAVLGFGNQGEAQALNLRDSGVRVIVGLRPGSETRRRAAEAGFEISSLGDAVAVGDVVALMVPDDVMASVVAEAVEPSLEAGATVVFAHGFPLRFGGVVLPDGVDVVVVAPMGPGVRLRERFLEGAGLPASFAVVRDATGRARRTALEYGKAIGCARVGLFETTVAEETEIDLFSEQAVLCGGITRLIAAAFDTLVEAGYSPELAYLECAYELDLTVGLIRRYGISGMRERISHTALYGDLTRGDRVIGAESRAGMRAILSDVRDGTFAREMEEDEKAGGAQLKEFLERERGRLIEEVGRRLADVVRAEYRETS